MRFGRAKDKDVIAYGCSSHSFNNYAKDVSKNPVIQCLILFFSAIHCFFGRCIRPLAYFQNCMMQTIGKLKVLASLGKTQFGSCKVLIETTLALKPALVMYSNLSITDDTFDNDCEFPPGLLTAVTNRGVWVAMSAALEFYRPITSALFELQGDSVPMSTTTACFLYMKKHLHMFSTSQSMAASRRLLQFDETELKRLKDCLDRRWLRIRHPVHYLDMTIDPLFIGLRADGVTSLGGEILQIESLKALRWIIALHEKSLPAATFDDEAKLALKNRIIAQYSDWMITSGKNEMVEENKLMHPDISWGLFMAYWPDLAQLAVPVSTMVATPCGGEKNFKIMSRVDSESRKGLGDIKADKQTAFVYSHAKLEKQQTSQVRLSDFLLMFRSFGGTYSAFGDVEMQRYEEIMTI